MQINDTLIAQFLNGETDDNVSVVVAAWLKAHPDALYAHLHPDWEHSGEAPVPAHLEADMWAVIKQTTVAKSRRRYFRLLPWAAAILMLPVLVQWWKWEHPFKKTTPVLAQVTPHTAPVTLQWDTVYNHGRHIQQVRLPDGSLVSLYANARLCYTADYNVHARTLLLEGQATFNVAKEPGKPFTVATGKIVTTALGTVFNITARPRRTTVQLYSGKVKVQAAATGLRGWKEDVYLLPGQQCSYETNAATVAVSNIAEHTNFNSDNAKTTVPILVTAKAIVFDHATLPEVMQQLMQTFQIQVQYDEATLRHMHFSGTVLLTDQPDVILQIIARMNGLSVAQADNGFMISTAHH